jgi:hypothetical protein
MEGKQALPQASDTIAGQLGSGVTHFSLCRRFLAQRKSVQDNL